MDTVMIVAGAVISIIGLLLIVSFAISRARCTARIEATVSELAEKSMNLRGRTVKDITPIFIYTVNGKKYTYKAEMSTTNKKRFAEGQKEYIYINVNDPQEARYGSNTGFLIFGIVCLFIGLSLTVLSLM